jgi:hypothetical protein
MAGIPSPLLLVSINPRFSVCSPFVLQTYPKPLIFLLPPLVWLRHEPQKVGLWVFFFLPSLFGSVSNTGQC